jgi:hypothetical protein
MHAARLRAHATPPEFINHGHGLNGRFPPPIQKLHEPRANSACRDLLPDLAGMI